MVSQGDEDSTATHDTEPLSDWEEEEEEEKSAPPQTLTSFSQGGREFLPNTHGRYLTGSLALIHW